jgi:hypothetical protein
MSLVNVSELLTDPDFVQALTGTRETIQIATTGDAAGEAIVTATPLSFSGVAMPLRSAKDLELLPEGLRNLDAVIIYTNYQLFDTNGDDGTATPGPAIVDTIQYHGKAYKVYVCEAWSEYGYYKAIAVGQP